MLPPLVRLTRPGNALLTGVGVGVGALVAGAASPTLRIVLGTASAIAFAAAGNVRNDVVDVEVDRVAHPARPLPRGEASTRAANALAASLYVASVAAAAFVSPLAAVLVLLALPLMEAYERGLKQRGLAGNLAIAALAGAPFVMGALAVGGASWPLADGAPAAVGPTVLLVAFLAALATAGREVLKDAEDADADRGHRVTLPMQVGARRAAWVAAAFLAAAILLSPLPYALESVLAWPYLPAVGLADAFFLAAAVAGVGGSPSRGQRLAKAGMVLAMAAMVIGALWGRLS